MASLLEIEVFLSHIMAGNEEKEAICVDPHASPQEKVEQAAACLRSLEDEHEPITPQLSFQRWTILDYARAYKSGQTTPTKVHSNFLEHDFVFYNSMMYQYFIYIYI